MCPKPDWADVARCLSGLISRTAVYVIRMYGGQGLLLPTSLVARSYVVAFNQVHKTLPSAP